MVFAATEWNGIAASLPSPGELSDPGAGDPVVTHRTSWVRRLAIAGGLIYVKTYDYPTWGARLGNWAKHTAPWRRSRPSHEVRALVWLAANGFHTPRPLAVLEWRTAGFLRRATLATTACAGEPADRLLAIAPAAERPAIATAIGGFVAALHRCGFRDRNLDLRNLIVHRNGPSFVVAKIDSPRFRLVRPGDRDDRLRRADWQRLLPQLATFGVADAAVAAARAVVHPPGQVS